MGERVETKQAEYRTDIARLAEQSALRDKEAAQRESRLAEQSVQREIRLIFAMIAIVGFGLTIFGFLTA